MLPHHGRPAELGGLVYGCLIHRGQRPFREHHGRFWRKERRNGRCIDEFSFPTVTDYNKFVADSHATFCDKSCTVSNLPSLTVFRCVVQWH